jgi:hypothetical protein
MLLDKVNLAPKNTRTTYSVTYRNAASRGSPSGLCEGNKQTLFGPMFCDDSFHSYADNESIFWPILSFTIAFLNPGFVP